VAEVVAGTAVIRYEVHHVIRREVLGMLGYELYKGGMAWVSVLCWEETSERLVYLAQSTTSTRLCVETHT
jgi:hypothetical protein